MSVFWLAIALPPNRGWFAIAEDGTLDAKRLSLGVNPLNCSPLVVDAFVKIAVAVKGIAKTRTNGGRHLGGAATALPEFVMDRTHMGGAFGMKQRAHIFAAFVFDQARGSHPPTEGGFPLRGGAISESELERHGQAGLTHGRAIGCELAVGDGLFALLGERHGGESPWGFAASGMKIGIDIPTIECGMAPQRATFISSELRPVSETLFGLGHEREEIGQIAMMAQPLERAAGPGRATFKGLSQLGQNELTQLRDFGDDDTRTIAPVELADGDCGPAPKRAAGPRRATLPDGRALCLGVAGVDGDTILLCRRLHPRRQWPLGGPLSGSPAGCLFLSKRSATYALGLFSSTKAMMCMPPAAGGWYPAR